MNLEKLTFPLMIAAAIVGLWVVLRPKAQPTVATQPSAAASGLPNYLPAVQTYQVNPPQLAAPAQPIVFADPYNTNPGQPYRVTPPPYLAFNLGPGHDFSKVPLTPEQHAQMGGDRSKGNGCGCGGMDLNDCGADANHGMYPDGRGGVMSKNGPQLITRLSRQDPGWLNRAVFNLGGSDINPATLPIRGNASIQQIEAQPGTASQAQSTQALAVSSPGSDVVSRPAISTADFLAPWKAKSVARVVGTVDTRVAEVGTNLFTYGHQVPRLGNTLARRLARMPMVG